MNYSGLVRRAAGWLVAAVVLGFLAAGVVALRADPQDRPDRIRAVAADLGRLPEATTYADLGRVPRERGPLRATDGDVGNPTRMLAVYATPGRRPFAKVGPRQFGPTWLPVVEQRRGWSRVLLPSRPNGATGWVRTAALELRRSPYLVRVHVGSRELELFYEGRSVGRWTVAVGAPGTETPVGRTFILGSITDPDRTTSPVVLPLGTHSETLDTYGGGPGTVAIHTWPDPSVFGQAVSHGCIRVPADALERLTQVPLGTLVLIDRR